jgi:hypothetical protein
LACLDQWQVGGILSSGLGCSIAEYLAKNLPLLVREQVPIAPALGLRLVAHELVDESLINTLRRKVRSKGVSQHVPTS